MKPEPCADTVRETRARRRIRQAVEAKGYRLVFLEWEPWSPGGEKSGICGGWYGEVDPPYCRWSIPGTEIMGLSVDEVLAWIEEFVPALIDGGGS